MNQGWVEAECCCGGFGGGDLVVCIWGEQEGGTKGDGGGMRASPAVQQRLQHM